MLISGSRHAAFRKGRVATAWLSWHRADRGLGWHLEFHCSNVFGRLLLSYQSIYLFPSSPLDRRNLNGPKHPATRLDNDLEGFHAGSRWPAAYLLHGRPDIRQFLWAHRLFCKAALRSGYDGRLASHLRLRPAPHRRSARIDCTFCLKLLVSALLRSRGQVLCPVFHVRFVGFVDLGLRQGRQQAWRGLLWSRDFPGRRDALLRDSVSCTLRGLGGLELETLAPAVA